MQKINQSRKWMCVAAVVMFLIMLVANVLTDKCTDDFHYMHSFTDWETPIRSVAEIFPSMRAHSWNMNGRIIPHFFVQLLLLAPDIVFDVLNSLMFLAQVYLVYRLASRTKERNVLLFCLVFTGIWLFELAFGQVSLWHTGSCNYMWNMVFVLLFLVPYADKVFHNRDIRGAGRIALYLLLSFVAGAYSENASSAMIFTGFFLACYAKFVLRYKLRPYHYAALAVAFAGFLTIVFAPASRVKGNEFSLWNMIVSIGRTGNMFYKMWPVVLGFAVLLTVACFRKLPREVIVTAVIIAAGAVFAELIMIIGDYNVERRAVYTLVMLIAACALLFRELMLDSKYLVSLVSVGVCLLLAGGYYISLGVCDIAITHRDILKNEAYIASCKAQGQMEIVLPDIETRTKYSALTGLQYLREDSEYWLNKCMARYYGVDKLTKAPEK